MSFYHHRSWILFYLLFTDLNLSAKISNENIAGAFRELKILIADKLITLTLSKDTYFKHWICEYQLK